MSEDAPTYEDEILDGELSAYPVWRQAALDAVATFSYGETITLEWLAEHLEIPPREGLLSAEQHTEIAFEWLRKVDGFRDTMLREHQRYLSNIRGYGYRIVEPPNQTREALHKASSEVARSVGKAMSALVHINDQMLTLDEMRENADAKARVGWLSAIGPKHLQPPKKEAEKPDVGALTRTC